MIESKLETEYWKKFLGKYISLLKKSNSQDFYYNGTVKAVFENKLILDDRKLGEIPISFDGLTIIGGSLLKK